MPNKVRAEKEKLKVKNLTLLGTNKPIYIKDSLFTYYKKLLAKGKQLRNGCKQYWTDRSSQKCRRLLMFIQWPMMFTQRCCSLVTILLRAYKGFRFYFYLNWVCVSWSDSCVSVQWFLVVINFHLGYLIFPLKQWSTTPSFQYVHLCFYSSLIHFNSCF